MATAYRICPLCEATCGLELTIEQGRVTGARGDRDDVFSHGFICPKGATFDELENDPDRLRAPVVRIGGDWREVTWDEAFAAVERGLTAVAGRHGRQALAIYLGNPNAHTLAGGLYAGPLVRALGTTNVYTASTVDQMPKHVSSGLMFGDPLAIPVPDLDRTSYLLILGANPVDSGGSLCTAADFPGRLRALRDRGGTLVVVDPRRTRTARLADRHLGIRPGTDAYLLFAVVHTLFEEGLTGRRDGGNDPDRANGEPEANGADEVAALARDFTPERVAGVCGVAAPEIRRLARELAAAPSAAVYARIGTSTAAFGTVTSWLVDVLNVLTGNLDRPGGAMFPLAPHRPAGARSRRAFRLGRWHSRVRGLPEVRGELPATTLVDEIVTPGEGQVRALVTVAGNPVLSTPGGDRLGEALGALEFMVSVDPYLNETTRHAHVVLPPPTPSRSPHFDLALSDLAVRNTARYSPPVLPLPDGEPDECAILARLTRIASGRDVDVDEAIMIGTLRAATADPASPVHGEDPAALLARLTGDSPALRRLDLMLRLGAYGDGFGAVPDGLSLEALRRAPHGVDLGPLRPRLPGLLRTPSGRIELCPRPIADEVARLRDGLAERRTAGLVLIGRRHLRSNNSWMHNLPGLVRGSNRCTLQVHPDDARRLGLADTAMAEVTSDAGAVSVEVEVTDEVMPGVVSLPHGWGHGRPGARGSVAAAHAGVSANALTDPRVRDPLSGNAVLNGIPVRVHPI
jgi:anaerobic selenocysteine-containing dehydrogenase